MKDRVCLICKYNGIIALGKHLDIIYQDRGEHRFVPLCYYHSVELFKCGQVKFISKYNHNFEEDLGLSNKKPDAPTNYFSLSSFR